MPSFSNLLYRLPCSLALSFVLSLYLSYLIADAPCTLDIQNDLPLSNLQPLYLHPNTDSYWLPTAKGELQIPRGANIELYCTHSFSIGNSDGSYSHNPSIHVRCLHDKTFAWEGGKWELGDFTCAKPLTYTVERMNQSCGDGDVASHGRVYRVGYNISAGRFVRTIELCHDADQLRTHYASYQLVPANALFQRQVKRVKFSSAGHFSGYDMNDLYSQKNQLKQVAKLVKQPIASAPVSSFLKEGQYLTRGHLASKADFIYASQQRSSFNYLNVAPQWQRFNNGHWQIVEDKMRQLVARLDLSVTVYTGTYGVMPVPQQSEAAGFHLATDAEGEGVLPVPRLYYRVLIDNQNRSRGLALVGVNNPHATLSEIEDSYIICPPVDVHHVSLLLRWLQAEDLKKGYLYACRVADLAKAVGHLPPQLEDVNELIES